MRKIVLDFDLTIVCPLILFALITLWHSIRAYRRFLPSEKEKWNARRVTWLSSGVLLGMSILLFVPDAWKALVAYNFWMALWVISGVSFLITIAAAWHYAKRAKWFHLGACVLVMLMIVASAEHFFHQKINANHVICPTCSESYDN